MQSLVQQGLDLALYGMGTVFVFLTMLVIATSLMSRIVLAFEPAIAAEADLPSLNGTSDPRLIAVITAAIQQFRSDHQKP